MKNIPKSTRVSMLGADPERGVANIQGLANDVSKINLKTTLKKRKEILKKNNKYNKHTTKKSKIQITTK